MLPQSHVIIGSYIFNHIKMKLNVDLSLRFLQIGSMKPDFWPSLKLKKHYKNESFDFVLDEIMKLSDVGLYDNVLSINKFSSQLGVINHFISDFFCLAHHDRDYFKTRLTEHLFYELLLHKNFKEFNEEINLKVPEITEFTRDSVKNLIENLHNQYTSLPHSKEKDVYFSINVSCIIGLLIVENSLMLSTKFNQSENPAY